MIELIKNRRSFDGDPFFPGDRGQRLRGEADRRKNGSPARGFDVPARVNKKKKNGREAILRFSGRTPAEEKTAGFLQKIMFCA